jgi:hypothetical protein
MVNTKFAARQVIYRSPLNQIQKDITVNSAKQQLNSILNSIDSEVTPPYQMLADGTNRNVTIGSALVSNVITTGQDISSPLSDSVTPLEPTFSATVLTFPTNSGDSTTGAYSNISITIPTIGHYTKVLICVHPTLGIYLVQGGVAATAGGCSLPQEVVNCYTVGYVILHRTSTIDTISQSDCYQFSIPKMLPKGSILGTTDIQTLTNKTYLAIDGSAASPSYSFSSDLNTGIFKKAIDTIGFSTAGVEVGSISATSWILGQSGATAAIHRINGTQSILSLGQNGGGLGTERNCLEYGREAATTVRASGFGAPGAWNTDSNGDKIVIYNNNIDTDFRIGHNYTADYGIWIKAMGASGPTAMSWWGSTLSSGSPNLLGKVEKSGSWTFTPAGSTTTFVKINSTLSSTSSTDGALVVAGGVGIGGDTQVAGSVTIAGNLTVNGTSTVIDTKHLVVEDSIIRVNKNQTGTPASFMRSGLVVDRGTSNDYELVFDEASDTFRVGECIEGTVLSATATTLVMDTVDFGIESASVNAFDGKTISTSGSKSGVVSVGGWNLSTRTITVASWTGGTPVAGETYRLSDLSQAVATRENTPVSNGFAYWDSVSGMFKTTLSPSLTDVSITNLTASSLVATDSNKKLTSSISSLSPVFAGLSVTNAALGASVSARFNASNGQAVLSYLCANGNPYLGLNTTQTASSDDQTYSAAGKASRILNGAGGDALRIDVAPTGVSGNGITWQNAMRIADTGEVTLAKLPTFSRGTSVVQTFNPAAAQDIQSLQKRTGLHCDGNADYATGGANPTGVGTGDYTVIFMASIDGIATGNPAESKLGSIGATNYFGKKSNSLVMQVYTSTWIDTSVSISEAKIPFTFAAKRTGGLLTPYMNGNAGNTLACVQNIGNGLVLGGGTIDAWLGSIYRGMYFNYALPEDKIRRYSAGERLDWEDLNGSMTPFAAAQTWNNANFTALAPLGQNGFTYTAGVNNYASTNPNSFSIVAGITYRIFYTVTGTNYCLRMGFISNGDSVTYGTTDLLGAGSTYVDIVATVTVTGKMYAQSYGSAGSGSLAITSIVKLGALAAYEPENLTPSQWHDSSGNSNDLTIVGATVTNLPEVIAFKRGSAVPQYVEAAALADIQSMQKKTGLVCLNTTQYASAVGTFTALQDFTSIVQVLPRSATISGTYEIFATQGSNTPNTALGVDISGKYYFSVASDVVLSTTTKSKDAVSLCSIRSGSYGSLYVNGRKEKEAAISNTTISNELRIGTFYNGTLTADATILRRLLFNYALPEDKVRRYSAGERLDWEDLGGSMTSLVTGDSSTFTTAQGSGATYASWAVTGGVNLGSVGGQGQLDITTGAATRYIGLAGCLVIGKRYKASLSVQHINGSTQPVYVGSAMPSGVSATAQFVINPTATNTMYTGEFTAAGTEFEIGCFNAVVELLGVDNIIVIPLGALAAYEPENLTPSQWHDCSGNANDLTITGATVINLPEVVAFKRGSAVPQYVEAAALADIQSTQKRTGLQFAQTNTATKVGDASIVNTGDFTLISTIMLDRRNSIEDRVIYVSTNSYNECMGIKLNPTGNFVFTITNSGSDLITGTSVIPTKSVVTLSAKRSGSSVITYIDGKQEATGTSSKAQNSGSVPVIQLGNSTTGYAMLGSINRGMYFNYALPEDKIRRYSAGERLDWEDIGGSMGNLYTGISWSNSSFDPTFALPNYTDNSIPGLAYTNAVFNLTAGKTYRINYTSATGIPVQFDFTDSGISAAISSSAVVVNAGSYVDLICTTSNATARLRAQSTANGSGTITIVSIIQLGALAAYEPEFLTPSTWYDSSLDPNDTTETYNDLTVTGATVINGNPAPAIKRSVQVTSATSKNIITVPATMEAFEFFGVYSISASTKTTFRATGTKGDGNNWQLDNLVAGGQGIAGKSLVITAGGVIQFTSTTTTTGVMQFILKPLDF